MTKKTEYQVTCSYDMNQTGNVKYDSYIIRAFEKIGGVLSDRFEDEYGSRDVLMTVHSDLNSLQKACKDLLHDLQRKEVKLNLSARKVEYALNIETSQFADFNSFQALAAGWAAEKNLGYQNQGASLKIIFRDKKEIDEFKNSLLPQANIFTLHNQTPSYFIDEVPEPVLNSDNYNAKKKSSFSVD